PEQSLVADGYRTGPTNGRGVAITEGRSVSIAIKERLAPLGPDKRMVLGVTDTEDLGVEIIDDIGRCRVGVDRLPLDAFRDQWQIPRSEIVVDRLAPDRRALGELIGRGRTKGNPAEARSGSVVTSTAAWAWTPPSCPGSAELGAHAACPSPAGGFGFGRAVD